MFIIEFICGHLFVDLGHIAAKVYRIKQYWSRCGCHLWLYHFLRTVYYIPGNEIQYLLFFGRVGKNVIDFSPYFGEKGSLYNSDSCCIRVPRLGAMMKIRMSNSIRLLGAAGSDVCINCYLVKVYNDHSIGWDLVDVRQIWKCYK